MNYSRFKLACILLITAALSGCISIPTADERQLTATKLAQQAGWEGRIIQTPDFSLQSFLPKQIEHANTLSIYIEGDGLAWITSRTVSSNPTPTNPLALKLALLGNNVSAYLGRPCQYVTLNSGCDASIWTSHRFSEKVVEATNIAIDQLKIMFSAKHIRLIGYSGGGAIAALVAARRNDVSGLITVAGNLDHVAWTKHHRATPLNGSLNPADHWEKLKHIPQIHFIGQNDDNVGYFVANAYSQRFPASEKPKLKVISNTDHHCCWERLWPKLINAF